VFKRHAFVKYFEDRAEGQEFSPDPAEKLEEIKLLIIAAGSRAKADMFKTSANTLAEKLARCLGLVRAHRSGLCKAAAEAVRAYPILSSFFDHDNVIWND
jgi:hypothetical protein